ncbi:lipase [Martelella sp. HB161492]|uniref:alpha/beta fold hydrolase n=1 Tax=Martelella sp. HB161492 TaxID=2720726 RepID=UPI0015923D0E|nr:lipase [Martelella sp. HB161492]
MHRRIVFHIGGYERNNPERFFRRFARGLSRFETCWSLSTEILSSATEDEYHTATARISCRDGERESLTDFCFLDFDDLVVRDVEKPFLLRLGKYAAAVADYAASGTLWRFFRANWRFALYFLFPIGAMALFLLAGLLVFLAIDAVEPFPGQFILASAAGIATIIALGNFPGRRYLVYHLMDLWSFSSRHLRARRPDMDARFVLWTDFAMAKLAAGNYDEVLLVGHSTGGALILDFAYLLSERLRQEGVEAAFTIVTVGSTALKISLHPAAKRARSRLEALAGQPGIAWHDFQSLTDIINFYKCDPYALAGLTHDRAEAFPYLYRVRFRHTLDEAQYSRLKRNFFRVHYQFISANSRRYFYDYFMMTCGTRALSDQLAAMDASPAPKAGKEAA